MILDTKLVKYFEENIYFCDVDMQSDCLNSYKVVVQTTARCNKINNQAYEGSLCFSC